ncbi:MAG: hypothetical protein GF384_04520, partial [Elusimicrobia bacterium]|nr:hypothetical protein [Elusimicrobiota bacterium]
MFNFRGKSDKPDSDHPDTSSVQNNDRREQNDQPVNRSQPPAIDFEKSFNEAREKALAKIRDFEHKLADERTAWAEKLKIKEEERINLEAHCEQVEKNTAVEKERSDLELKNAQQTAEQELHSLENFISDLKEQWAVQERNDERLLDELKNRKNFDDAQMQLEREERKRAQEHELGLIEEQLKKLQTEGAVERAHWIRELKRKDEHNVSLRTKLAILETRVKNEAIERERQMRRDQDQWAHRIKELEEQLSDNQRTNQQQRQEKEVEIAAMRDIMEKKRLEHRRRIAHVEESYARERKRIEDTIAGLKKQFLMEKETWDRLASRRDEEFNKLKMQLTLTQSQDKADAERLKHELQKSKESCEKRIRSLQRKIEEEEHQA